MTIIVYRDGVMVSDSKATSGDFFVGKTQKIYETKNFIIGSCGEKQDCIILPKYFETPPENRNYNELKINEPNGLLFDKRDKKIYYFDDKLRPYFLKDKFYAVGSGSFIAFGAMEAGASAEEAVKIVIRRIPSCGFPIQKVICIKDIIGG